MLESLEKMRKSLIGYQAVTGEDMGAFLLHADEVQAEIAECYMELPKDADGVPIRVGDVMTLRHGKTCEVVAVSETQFTGKKLGSENCVCHANLHRHVKPRTLEDVLADFAADVENDRNNIERARKYADEIRELLGGDAE